MQTEDTLRETNNKMIEMNKLNDVNLARISSLNILVNNHEEDIEKLNSDISKLNMNIKEKINGMEKLKDEVKAKQALLDVNKNQVEEFEKVQADLEDCSSRLREFKKNKDEMVSFE